MDEEHKRNWKWFADEIKESLDKGSIHKDVAFTLHDFSHHCYNIYNIISTVILYKESFNNSELSSEALYLLNIAVLFHDYSMTRPNFNRLRHSAESEDMFKEFWKTRAKNKLTKKQVDIICCIIYAHSNIKEVDINNKEKNLEITINDIRLDKNPPGDIEDVIYTKFLAGVLRLADELDLTEDRVGEYEDQLKNLDKDNKSQMYSLSCWEELQLFSAIKCIDNDVVLSLNADKYYEDSTKAELIIEKVLKKANDSLALITDSCFKGTIRRLILCTNIKVEESNIRIISEKSESAVLHQINLVDENNKEDYLDNSDIPNNPGSDKKTIIVSLINQSISKKLDTYVFDENLLIGGHFNLNDFLCTRDWINSNYILDCKEMRYKIYDEFKNHICKRWGSENLQNTLIVGIEVYGTIIASSVAFDLKLPCAYIIPEKSKEKHSMQDKRFSADKYKNIILFTDVIVSGDTVKEVIKLNNLSGKVNAIYTVFYRPILNEIEFVDILKKDNNIIEDIPIYSLNDKFAITLFPKKHCPIGSLSQRCNKDFMCIDCHKLNM
jgi:orotate phosphoribosyltransferase